MHALAIAATVRRRLLLNAVVDPDEAAARLPAGVRPHVTPLGTVVGCCLLELEHARPAGLPAAAGRSVLAAAHRISVEWDEPGNPGGPPTVGVYVPVRHTASRLGAALGGRAVPGVHRRADITLDAAGPGPLRWAVDDAGGDPAYRIRAAIVAPEHAAPADAEPVGCTCLGADEGLSPGPHGLEVVRLVAGHRRARAVALVECESAFLAGFATARPAPAYLAERVPVTFTSRTRSRRRAGRPRAAGPGPRSSRRPRRTAPTAPAVPR